MQESTTMRLRCPECRQQLTENPVPLKDVVVCSECGAEYPTRDGVIDLVPKLVLHRSPIQRFMESAFLVKIYESKLYRRSFVLSLLTGIRFDREVRAISEAAAIKAYDKVLDVACGTGNYSRPFAQKASNGQVVGIDISMPMLNWAEAKKREKRIPNLTFMRGDAMNLPFFDASFGVVNCVGALHLFPDVKRAVVEAFRVLDSGGRFTLGTVLRRNQTAGNLLRRVLGVESFTWEELTFLLESVGFSEIESFHTKSFWVLACAKMP